MSGMPRTFKASWLSQSCLTIKRHVSQSGLGDEVTGDSAKDTLSTEKDVFRVIDSKYNMRVCATSTGALPSGSNRKVFAIVHMFGPVLVPCLHTQDVYVPCPSVTT